MNKVLHSIRSLLLCTAAFLPMLSGAMQLKAADPEIVGVLADAIDPPIAKALDLNDDQLASIRSLIDSQESRILDLNDKARDMPKAAAQEMMQKSISDLEAEAFKVLTVEQRSKLEQVRLNRIGLRSLSEASVAETLGLSEGQRDQIQAVLGGRIQILREVGPDRVEIETQNRLRKVLTNFQFATWQTMAGGGKVPPRSAAVADASPEDAVPALDSASQPASDESAASENEQVASTPAAKVSATKAESRPTPRATSDEDEARLVINFNGADWGTVLKWMAREADLNLQLNTVPTGTFTYRDSNKYSVAKAMDIMNGILLGNGYTLVRRQRTLMVVDLGSGESADVTRGLIRELAQLVTPDQLDDRGDYELLKCLFQLSRLTPEETEKQVKLLIGPHGSVIPLASANQILVVETGEKLRLIRDLIEQAENPDPSKSTKVASFTLNHVTAEEVLSIARGHLGLEDDKSTSDDITVSTDPIGNTIYATGRADKIQLLSEIVAKVDVEPASDGPMSVQIQKPEFRAHPVVNGDLDAAMEVLQTMLAGTPNIHLGKDTVSKSITALAPPAEHELIKETLQHIGGNAVQFQTIKLKRLDPKSAILYLEKLLGKAAEGDAAKAGASPPAYVGDATSKTLMVKGTSQQIEQVRQIIDEIESTSPNTSMLGDRMRFVPTNGKSPERVIKDIQMLFNAQKRQAKINVHSAHSDELDAKTNTRRTQLGADPLPKELPKELPASSKVKKPGGKSPTNSSEPTTSVESHEKDKSKPKDLSDIKVPVGKLVQTDAKDESPDTNADDVAKSDEVGKSDEENSKDVPQLEIFETPGGLVVTSEDPELLAQFEQLSSFLNDQIANGPVKPTIFYLKFVPAGPTADFIRQVMSGKVATESSGGGGGLIGDTVSSMLGGFGGGLLGGALGGGSGGTVNGPSLASGEFSIVPDPRMNLMIVYANPIDLELIDQIVDTLDREDSPLLVQLSGRPQIIPVQYADATEVAGIVKEAFANRLAQAQNGGGAAGGGNNNRQPSPQDFIAALRGGNGRGAGGNQPTPMPEPKMTISVDTRNNAIIVTGPNALYEEVRDFVEKIDQGSEDTQEDVQVVQLGGKVNASVLQGALQSVLGPQAKTNMVGQTTNGQVATGQTNTSPSPRDMQQRADFMRQFQGGGNFGGGNRGFGGGNFGGGNFGGGFGGNFGGQNRGGGNNNQGRTGGGNNQGRTGGANQGRAGGNQGRGGR